MSKHSEQKGDRSPLCEAPFGPFRQKGTVPILLLLVLAAISAWTEQAAQAQPSKARQPRARQYQVEVQVQAARGVGKFMVLEWIERARAAGAAGASELPGFAEPSSQDSARAAVREKGYGQVLVYAVVNRAGNLHIGRNVFRGADQARLRAFLKRIRQEGVPAPDPSEPMWGLSDAQLHQLQAVLRPESNLQLQNVRLDELLGLLRGRSSLPVELTPEARRLTSADRFSLTTGRLSLGAAIAYLLHQHDLAFEPRADLNGKLSLLVLTRSESKRPWPIGLTPERSPGSVAPQLFRFTRYQTTEATLDEVLAALARVLGMDVLLDTRTLAAHNIDPSTLRSTVQVPRSTWDRAIRKTLTPLGLKHELRIDEASHPFLWITVARPAGIKGGAGSAVKRR